MTETTSSHPLDRWRHVLPLLTGAASGVAFRWLFGVQAFHMLDVMARAFVVGVPIVVSSVSVYVAEKIRPRSSGYHMLTGASANALFVLGTFLMLIEGIICVILAAPLFAALGAFWGVIFGKIYKRVGWPKQRMLSVVALPLLFSLVPAGTPGTTRVLQEERSLLIDATPKQVWQELMQAPHIAPSEMDQGWMYRIGAPLPLSAVTRQEEGRLIRHIRMGRGVEFDQVAQDWVPDKRILWRYRFTDTSFPPGALDEHVKIGGKYFDLIDTVYNLTSAAQGTVLHVTMHYRVDTDFNWYARPITRFLVGNFEETALAFYSRRAEWHGRHRTST